jgi:hypothetical protein
LTAGKLHYFRSLGSADWGRSYLAAARVRHELRKEIVRRVDRTLDCIEQLSDNIIADPRGVDCMFQGTPLVEFYNVAVKFRSELLGDLQSTLLRSRNTFENLLLLKSSIA